MHYLRHRFRWRNSNKGHGKARYRLYGFPWVVEVQVLEELKATDDEAGADYSVGVDFDMSVGPQFIPPVEMKENNELLDTWDDGDNSDNGGDGGDGGDRGDGDDGAPIGIIGFGGAHWEHEYKKFQKATRKGNKMGL
ncbi:hypothetical protein Q3G72_033210 [Acer saccharum]|nr:hypothetical protein Q3G72_033210 [Acer saccharum]